ncbi:hypothetical protein C8R43DRAFT_960973 [Mycena crocata]|nr:hypothetical protein C8R43DRAFT_960973 [Mycena crocata]
MQSTSLNFNTPLIRTSVPFSNPHCNSNCIKRAYSRLGSEHAVQHGTHLARPPSPTGAAWLARRVARSGADASVGHAYSGKQSIRRHDGFSFLSPPALLTLQKKLASYVRRVIPLCPGADSEWLYSRSILACRKVEEAQVPCVLWFCEEAPPEVCCSEAVGRDQVLVGSTVRSIPLYWINKPYEGPGPRFVWRRGNKDRRTYGDEQHLSPWSRRMQLKVRWLNHNLESTDDDSQHQTGRPSADEVFSPAKLNSEEMQPLLLGVAKVIADEKNL